MLKAASNNSEAAFSIYKNFKINDLRHIFLENMPQQSPTHRRKTADKSTNQARQPNQLTAADFAAKNIGKRRCNQAAVR